ncbi:unnamed protein product, partial [Mesorhabditis spiculigera]
MFYPPILGLPTWLWKASTHHPLAPVEARNYGCWCTCCTSKCGFIIMIILWSIYTVFMLTALTFAVLAIHPADYANIVTRLEFWAFLCAIIGTFFGIRAIQTQKPAWMQLFLIAWTLITVIHTALLIYICIYERKGSGRIFPDHRGHLEDGYAWPVLLVSGIILAFYHTFMSLHFVSYYHYIRDCQLQLEQQHDQMQSIQTYK